MTATANAIDARVPRAFQYSNPSIRLIQICFIFSGATGLIYEVLWARMLGLVFGATTFAVATVLAAFMGGLALGSAWAGRRGARINRPLRAYGLIEIGIALYALAVPFLFGLIDDVYALIWAEFRPGFFAFSLWRFVLSCAALVIPTALMGATLPILSAALLGRRSHARSGTAVARLYTCNLVGAILGTLAAGFVLLPFFGLRATIATAAVINIIVGVASILIDRVEAKQQQAAVETAGVDREGETQERREAESKAVALGLEDAGDVTEANDGRKAVLVLVRGRFRFRHHQHSGRVDARAHDDYRLKHLRL